MVVVLVVVVQAWVWIASKTDTMFSCVSEKMCMLATLECTLPAMTHSLAFWERECFFPQTLPALVGFRLGKGPWEVTVGTRRFILGVEIEG